MRSFETSDTLTTRSTSLTRRAWNARKSTTSSFRGCFRLLRWSRCDYAVLRPTRTMCTSCRKSSMRKWRNCTPQEQANYGGVKVESPLTGGHYRYRAARFSLKCCRWQRVWLWTSCVRKHVRSLHRSTHLRISSSPPSTRMIARTLQGCQ